MPILASHWCLIGPLGAPGDLFVLQFDLSWPISTLCWHHFGSLRVHLFVCVRLCAFDSVRLCAHVCLFDFCWGRLGDMCVDASMCLGLGVFVFVGLVLLTSPFLPVSMNSKLSSCIDLVLFWGR